MDLKLTTAKEWCDGELFCRRGVGTDVLKTFAYAGVSIDLYNTRLRLHADNLGVRFRVSAIT